VTYTATDSYGNISSCSFSVLVEDKGLPVFQTCIEDIIVNATACDAVASWAIPTALDNCGTVTVVETHSPGSTFPLGTTKVSYTATDESGNSSVCKFNIIVKNEAPPTLEDCPDDISLTANEFGEATAEWFSPSALSTCGEVILTSSHKSGDKFHVGVTIVEYSAVDISGNSSMCRFNVTVVKQEIDIEISQVVTPDGNGVNDELIVANIEKFNNNKIVIVDRWGSVIYAASGYNNESIVWKGVNHEGSTVPTGTYFYSLSVRYGEDFIEKTGFIELIR
jgi:gliding motility-associated-like protein